MAVSASTKLRLAFPAVRSQWEALQAEGHSWQLVVILRGKRYRAGQIWKKLDAWQGYRADRMTPEDFINLQAAKTFMENIDPDRIGI